MMVKLVSEAKPQVGQEKKVLIYEEIRKANLWTPQPLVSMLLLSKKTGNRIIRT